MTFKKEYIFYIILSLAIITVIVNYSLKKKKNKSKSKNGKSSEKLINNDNLQEKVINKLNKNKWKLYGAEWCSWTVKQIEELGGMNNIRHLYVDCDLNMSKCSDKKIKGMPTWVNDKGDRYSGFLTLDKFDDLFKGIISTKDKNNKEETLNKDNSSNNSEIVNKLKNKGWKLYGAEWCGWTQKQIKDLGGKDKIKSIYVDCEKDEENVKK